MFKPIHDICRLSPRVVQVGAVLLFAWLSVLYLLAANEALFYGGSEVVFGAIRRHTPFVASFKLDGLEQTEAPQLRVSPALFPDFLDVPRGDGRHRWEGENNKAIANLFLCTGTGTCGAKQEKVVILSSFHFRGGHDGWTSGEDVWARSVINGLDALGYTYLFASSVDHTLRLYQMFPSLVTAVFMEESEQTACWNDDVTCVKSGHNPLGIPIWKILAFAFWPGPKGPLGAPWTLSPEPYGPAEGVYLGYSIERSCAQTPFVPHLSRSRAAPRAYVLAKRLEYLVGAWPREFFAQAARENGVQFVLGADEGEEKGKVEKWMPEGTVNFGLLDQGRFVGELSRSALLIGVGRPSTSPTPYEALCLGVPFLNPIFNWDRNDPTDRTKWDAQHGLAKYLDPPYVYNVFAGDREGFVNAVREAAENPIDSFVLERMQLPSVIARLEKILERDYYAEAEALLARRRAGADVGPSFTL
ncbi:hypothetical protein OF83DRAFT_1176177 [Amylostereum chailletii]|nr:hypothetical protein OF83DRAFT_1176177 [Amylostereum chailletii]